MAKKKTTEEEAKNFVDRWISDNVRATGYERDGDAREAKRHALECWRAIDKADISRAVVEATCGPLDQYMAEAIERANDAEVDRQIGKDKL